MNEQEYDRIYDELESLLNKRKYDNVLQRCREIERQHRGKGAELLSDLGDDIEESNPTQAMRFFKESATMGNSDGMYSLGMLYGDAEDYENSYYWLKKSYQTCPDFANADALANFYEFGYVVKKDLEVALELNKQAKEFSLDSGLYDYADHIDDKIRELEYKIDRSATWKRRGKTALNILGALGQVAGSTAQNYVNMSSDDDYDD